MTAIFVGGSQRSGTTLVQTILCASGATNPMIGEAKYFRQLVQAYAFGKRQFSGETRDYFKDLEELRVFHGGLIQRFLDHTLARFEGAKHLVLKEPHLTMLFPELVELLPAARFICVVRDPRDVIASMIEVGRKLDEKGIADDPMGRMFVRRDMRALSRHYLSFYLPALRSADSGFMERYLFLRYEDLVQKPDEAMKQVAAFTGLEIAGLDATADPGTGEVDFEKVNEYRKAWATKLYGKKADASRVGAFRKVLKPAEIAAVVQNCRGVMNRFKYPYGAGRAGQAGGRAGGPGAGKPH